MHTHVTFINFCYCYNYSSFPNETQVQRLQELTNSKELTVNQLYEEIGDMNTPTSTGNTGVSSSAPETGRPGHQYEDVEPVITQLNVPETGTEYNVINLVVTQSEFETEYEDVELVATQSCAPVTELGYDDIITQLSDPPETESEYDDIEPVVTQLNYPYHITPCSAYGTQLNAPATGTEHEDIDPVVPCSAYGVSLNQDTIVLETATTQLSAPATGTEYEDIEPAIIQLNAPATGAEHEDIEPAITQLNPGTEYEDIEMVVTESNAPETGTEHEDMEPRPVVTDHDSYHITPCSSASLNQEGITLETLC